VGARVHGVAGAKKVDVCKRGWSLKISMKGLQTTWGGTKIGKGSKGSVKKSMREAKMQGKREKKKERRENCMER